MTKKADVLPTRKADMISSTSISKNQFQKENHHTITPFKETEPKKLDRPFTGRELMKTTKCMKNGKVTADIPAELVKYASVETHNGIATTLNNVFEKHEDIDVGRGILISTQKSKPKPVGPIKNLRPITLLRLIRKILSRTETTRAAPKTKLYLSLSQSAYMRVEALQILYGRIEGY